MQEEACPIEKPAQAVKKGGLIGFLAGLLSALCCITPVVLIFFSLGSVSFAFSFIGYKPYFLASSLVFLTISFFFYLRKGKCSLKAGLKNPFILTALAVHLIISLGSFYLLLPIVGPYVFEKRLVLTRDVPEHSPSCHLQLKISSKSFNALNCTSCEAALKYALEQEEGVLAVEVDLADSKALVHYDKARTSSQEIIENIPADFEIKDKVDQC